MSSGVNENILQCNLFCRICMDKTENFINLFDNPNSHSICNKIVFCAGIQVMQHDFLPNKICLDCLHLLEAAWSFKNICIKSDALWKQILFGEMKAVIERNTFKNQLSVLKVENSSDSTTPQNSELHRIGLRLDVDTVRRVNVYKTQSNNTECTTQVDVYVPLDVKLKNELKEVIKIEVDVCDPIPIRESLEGTNENDCDWAFEPVFKEDSDIDNDSEKYEEDGENDSESIKNVVKVEKKDKFKKEITSKKTENAKRRAAKSRVKYPIESDDEFLLDKKSREMKSKCKHKEKKDKKQLKVNNEVVTCEICEAQVKRNSYNFHKQKHGPLLKCQECKYATHVQKRFDQHLIRHKEGKHVCNVCKANFKTVSGLVLHSINDHGTNKVYECDICFKGYADKYNLTNHLERVHNIKPKRPRKHWKIPKGKDPNKQSNKEEIQKKKINYHRRLQICDVCGIKIEVFKLYYHRLKHFPKSFICDLCTKGFYMKRDLEHHMRVTHLHNTPHVCRICGLASRCASHLRNHMETRHSSELKYACHVCGKQCRSLVIAKHHVAQHFGDRGYQVTCKLCNLSMKNHRYRMDEHMLKTHNVETKGCKTHDLLETVRLNTPSQKKIISAEFKKIKKINVDYSSQYSSTDPSTSLGQQSLTQNLDRSKPVGFQPSMLKQSNLEVPFVSASQYSPNTLAHSREDIQFSPISLKQRTSWEPGQFSPVSLKQQTSREQVPFSPVTLEQQVRAQVPFSTAPLKQQTSRDEVPFSSVSLKQLTNRDQGLVSPVSLKQQTSREQVPFSPVSLKQQTGREQVPFSPVSLKQEVSREQVQFSPIVLKQPHYSPDLKQSSQESNPSPLSLTLAHDARCSPVYSKRNFGPDAPILDSGNFNRVNEQVTGDSDYISVLKHEL